MRVGFDQTYALLRNPISELLDELVIERTIHSIIGRLSGFNINRNDDFLGTADLVMVHTDICDNDHLADMDQTLRLGLAWHHSTPTGACVVDIWRAAFTVLDSKQAIVIGPTPRGTGVMAAAC